VLLRPLPRGPDPLPHARAPGTRREQRRCRHREIGVQAPPLAQGRLAARAGDV